jgi:hypothetical protein
MQYLKKKYHHTRRTISIYRRHIWITILNSLKVTFHFMKNPVINQGVVSPYLQHTGYPCEN